MIISRRYVSGIPATLAAMGLVWVLGCGDDSGLSKRHPVTGTVKYKGEPVPKGTISFTPAEAGGRAAGGDIVDGNYSLSTTGVPDDGALPGSYKVTIKALEMDTKEMQAVAKGGQFHHDKTYLKSLQSAKKLVPSKYTLPETSGLTAEVKAQSNTINYDLQD
jgi:hypothetical protein